jgi:hypothetical protein
MSNATTGVSGFKNLPAIGHGPEFILSGNDDSGGGSRAVGGRMRSLPVARSREFSTVKA